MKIIKSNNNTVLYFTRHPIQLSENLKHIGIYGFRAQSLKRFVSLPHSMLEKNEDLEQLRALENDMKIKVVMTKDKSISVDTEEDLVAFQ